MFNNFKKKMVERSNKRILEYVLNTPEIWLEVLRIINKRYDNKIFGSLKIENNKFNSLKLDGFTILNGIQVNNNIYIPEDDNLKKPFIKLSNSAFYKNFEDIDEDKKD